MTLKYTWQDTGAPTLYAGSGKLIELLKACLVNGYGAFAGAGWTIEYEDLPNNKIVFKQPAGTNGRYLWVNDNLSSIGFRNAAIKLFETMSGIDTGTGETPTAAQEPNMIGIRKSVSVDSTVRPWRIFLTNNGGFFVLQIGVQCDASLNYMNSSARITLLGDLISHDPLDDWSTCIAGDLSNDTYSSGYGGCPPIELKNLGYKASYSYLMRGREQLNVSVPFGQLNGGNTGVEYGAGTSTYPEPSGLLHFMDVAYHDENISDKRLRGMMPLLKAPYQNFNAVKDFTLDGANFSLTDGSKSFMICLGGNYFYPKFFFVEI